MTDRSPSTLAAFVRSAPRTWWDTESGFYDAGGARLAPLTFVGPRPEVPVATRPTDCALEATGLPAAAITARCNRQGVPSPEGPGLIVARDGEQLQGNDLPNRLAGTEPIQGAGRGPSHILALRSGAVVQVYSSGPTLGVVCSRRDPTTGLWSAEVTVTTGHAHQPWPCVEEIVTESGATRLLLLHWSPTQIAAHWSADEGATWTDGGDILEQDISGTTHPWAKRGRIRMKWNPATGQFLLVAHTRSTVATYLGDVLLQCASADGAGLFHRVDFWDGSDEDNSGGYPDIALRDGVFYVAHIRKDNTGTRPFVSAIGDAWERIRTAARVEMASTGWLGVADTLVGAPDVLEEGEVAIWLDDDRAIYLTARDVISGTWYLARNTRRSYDEADWYTTGGATHQYWSYPNGGGRLSAVSATVQHGRTLITYDLEDTGQLHVGQLGGWSGLTLPSYGGTLSVHDRCPWDYAAPWNQSPTACWWTGYVGAEVQEVGRVALTGAGTYADTIGVTPTVTQGVMREDDFLLSPGVAGTQVHARITLGDASNAYTVEVRITETAMVLWDVVAGAQLSAAIAYTPQRIHVAMALTSTRARAFWRPASPVGHEEGLWTEIGSGVPTSTGAAGFTLLETQITAVATVRWYSSSISSGISTGTQWTAARANSTTHPRTLVPSGVWSPGAHILSAQTGPALPGDVWTVAIGYDYGPENLDPRGWTPGPSAPCLIATTAIPAGTTEIRLSWYTEPADSLAETDVWGSYLDGVRSASPAVRIHTAGAWLAWGTLPTDSFSVTATSTGRRLLARPAATPGTRDWIRADLDGSGCTVVGAIGFETHEIARSRGGSTKATSTFHLQVELLADPTIAPVSLIVWPTRGLHLRPLARNLRGVQVVLPVAAVATSPGRPSGGYYGLSVFAAGPALVAGMHPAVLPPRTLEPGVEVVTAQDRTRSASIIGQPQRTLEMRWEPIPDCTKADSVSSTLGGAAVAYRQDLDDQIELVGHEGARYPGVAVIDYARTSGGEWHIEGRGANYLYGRIMGAASTEPIGSSSRAARLPGWVIEEEL